MKTKNPLWRRFLGGYYFLGIFIICRHLFKWVWKEKWEDKKNEQQYFCCQTKNKKSTTEKWDLCLYCNDTEPLHHSLYVLTCITSFSLYPVPAMHSLLVTVICMGYLIGSIGLKTCRNVHLIIKVTCDLRGWINHHIISFILNHVSYLYKMLVCLWIREQILSNLNLSSKCSLHNW